MTLEEVKDRRAELVEHELDSDIMEMFCWLIGEVDRLRAELDSVHDYYTGAIERNVEATAQRCAEIAENFSYSGSITRAIRKEFGLEE
jgi:uncharacterized membrane protein YccC